MLKVVWVLLKVSGFSLFLHAGEFIPEPRGGQFRLDPVPCLTPNQRSAIQATLDSQILLLKQVGVLPAKASEEPVQFGWPLRQAENLNAFHAWAIFNHVDHNPAFPNMLRDYSGGTQTYDRENGYNHKGTDIVPWPFLWDNMINEYVAIVSVAPGVIIYKVDGNPDKNCDFVSPNWNAVYVRHEDGSVAWYGHMKTNSLTSKSVGESVSEGEFLGFVGSSGNSTGPHLHLEIYGPGGELNDPFAGPGNQLNATSWWRAQDPYYTPRINRLMTHSTDPVLGCFAIERVNAADQFAPGDTAFFAAYYEDQIEGMVSQYRVLDSAGNVFQSWEFASESFFPLSYWYWFFPIEPDAEAGIWTFEADFAGQTYRKFFAVGELVAPEITLFNASPNRIAPGESTTISWDTAHSFEVFLDSGLGFQEIRGSLSVSPSATTTYTIRARGPQGEISQMLTITVAEPLPQRVIAHVTSATGGFATDLLVANTGSQTVTYRLLGFNRAGEALATVEGELAGNQTLFSDVDTLFGEGEISHFFIDASEDVVVSAAYRAIGAGSPAHLSESREMAKRWRFYRGEWGFAWDGLAVVNRGDQSAHIEIQQLDRAGILLASQTNEALSNLAPMAKALAVLGDLGFDGGAQGYFQIIADQPVSLIALRGSQPPGPYFLWENVAIPLAE